MSSRVSVFIYLLFLTINLVFGETTLKSPRRDRDKTHFVVAFNAKAYSTDSTYYHAICKKWDYPLKMDCKIYHTHWVRDSVQNTRLLKNVTLDSGYHPEFNVDIEEVSLFVTYRGSFIFKWIEIQRDVVLNVRYTIIDDSHDDINLKFSINMPRDDPLFLNDLNFWDSCDIDIAVSSSEECIGMKRCLIRYKYHYENDKPIVKRYTSLNWNLTLDFATSIRNNKFNYYIQGYDSITKDYKLYSYEVFEYESKGRSFLLLRSQKEIMTAEPNTKLIVSQPSISSHPLLFNLPNCQVQSLTESSTTINCLQFEESNLVVNQTFEIPQAVRLFYTNSIFQYEMKSYTKSIVLLAEKINCIGDDCWNLFVVVVDDKNVKVLEQSKFDCIGDRKSISVYGEQIESEKVNIVYGCERLDEIDKWKSYFHVGTFSYQLVYP